jgi:hypothetical protein
MHPVSLSLYIFVQKGEIGSRREKRERNSRALGIRESTHNKLVELRLYTQTSYEKERALTVIGNTEREREFFTCRFENKILSLSLKSACGGGCPCFSLDSMLA